LVREAAFSKRPRLVGECAVSTNFLSETHSGIPNLGAGFGAGSIGRSTAHVFLKWIGRDPCGWQSVNFMSQSYLLGSQEP